MNSPIQQQLEQLKDIHPPAPIGFWPPAYGWWILLALGLAAIGYLIYIGYCRYKKRQQRKQWQQQLLRQKTQWQQQQLTSTAALQQCNQLLKAIAIGPLGYSEAAALHGEQWLIFLSGTTKQAQEPLQPLACHLYQKQNIEDLSSVFDAAEHWLLHAPEKPLKAKKNLKAKGGNL